VAQAMEGGGPVAVRIGSHRSWTSGQRGPVYPGEAPRSSSSVRGGQSMAVNGELLKEEAAAEEVLTPVVVAGGLSSE
jgi:hypothetical protein